ncbi:DNA cytosine methyltransferase [Rhodospirillaceae bacterium SYSU D60014]|uniref:DNA cytosine methyltransferase n=1 Tax=Virgifigura deserti TaxID=2268457 RepID=UPI000E666DDB
MRSAEQHRARTLKIEQLRAGGAPRVLELCSGCGGLALGLKSAGFELAAHIEADPLAAESYALNFAADEQTRARWAVARDMVECSADDLVNDLELGSETTAVFDILAAGLPCQAFARIGRSKLRELAGGEHDAFRKDPRAALYRRFLDYVTDTQPLAIIIENVPDILNFGGHNVPEEICEVLEDAGYRAAYTILNAAYYGVPQIRERLFLIAIADTLNVEPTFPDPTHFVELPRGYESSRSVALKYVAPDSRRFRPIHRPDRSLGKAVSVREALGDLPKIQEHWSDPKAMRRRHVTDRLPYRKGTKLSDYAQLMRTWSGFESLVDVDGHVVRLTPRDFPIFARMSHGADYPRARAIAEAMFARELDMRGIAPGLKDSPARAALWKAMVPPYDPAKFPNKWWKMDPFRPSRTLTAHIGKDTYSHIHYDSQQRRTVSVREAARLQSFPDGFRFAGAMNAAFRQIGNAVPPLLAKAVAEQLRKDLMGAAAALPRAIRRSRAA